VKPATLGFRAHSGWAAVVALAGDARSPELVARERIELADPRRPGDRQPYHAAEGLRLEAARRLLERLSRSARAMAGEGLGRLVEALRAKGCTPHGAVILQAGGRRGATLEATLASHALIHTADGEHFRDALADAAAGAGLELLRIAERELAGRAASAVGLPADVLRERVAGMGRVAGPPWTADQKAAALAAWLLLASIGPRLQPKT
jgi:hypothetical protein